MCVSNTYAKISSLASFHAGCDGNRRVKSPEACHRIGTLRDVAHPLRALCNIRSRKIMTAVAVALTQNDGGNVKSEV